MASASLKHQQTLHTKHLTDKNLLYCLAQTCSRLQLSKLLTQNSGLFRESLTQQLSNLHTVQRTSFGSSKNQQHNCTNTDLESSTGNYNQLAQTSTGAPARCIPGILLQATTLPHYILFSIHPLRNLWIAHPTFRTKTHLLAATSSYDCVSRLYDQNHLRYSQNCYVTMLQQYTNNICIF